jgi:hypothetical protein
MRAKSNTKAERGRTSAAAEDLDTIREVYERHGEVDRSDRWHLSANINHAAKVAGITTARLSYPEKYEQAEKALAGSKKYGAIEAVHWSCEQIRKVWNRPEGDPPPSRKKTRGASSKGGKTFTTSVECDNFVSFGLTTGSIIESVETHDILPGELITFRVKGTHESDDDRYIARFVSLTSESLTYAWPNDGPQSEDLANVEDLARVTRYKREVVLRRPDPATEAAPVDSPAQVIDLMCYRQAPPQRIRSLLFAEKR